jgi:hypothetical protein
MDANWKHKHRFYDSRFGNEERFFAIVIPTANMNNCWDGRIWNYVLGLWELKARSCGTIPESEWIGWTMWESEGLMTSKGPCPTFPQIRASDIKTLAKGEDAWGTLSGPPMTSNLGPVGFCWEYSVYTLYTPPDQHNYHWLAQTP